MKRLSGKSKKTWALALVVLLLATVGIIVVVKKMTPPDTKTATILEELAPLDTSQFMVANDPKWFDKPLSFLSRSSLDAGLGESIKKSSHTQRVAYARAGIPRGGLQAFTNVVLVEAKPGELNALLEDVEKVKGSDLGSRIGVVDGVLTFQPGTTVGDGWSLPKKGETLIDNPHYKADIANVDRGAPSFLWEDAEQLKTQLLGFDEKSAVWSTLKVEGGGMDPKLRAAGTNASENPADGWLMKMTSPKGNTAVNPATKERWAEVASHFKADPQNDPRRGLSQQAICIPGRLSPLWCYQFGVPTTGVSFRLETLAIYGSQFGRSLSDFSLSGARWESYEDAAEDRHFIYRIG